MERAHIQRLWGVAEELFQSQHKPLQAFFVLHLLLLHRPAASSASHSSTSAAAEYHRYVTDAIFTSATGQAAEDEGTPDSRAASHGPSTTRLRPPLALPHDVGRPSLPPYLKCEEALTRVRAVEMLLCPPPSPPQPSSSSSPSEVTAAAASSRTGLCDGLSKRASQQALTLAEQVIAPLLLVESGRGSSRATGTAAHTMHDAVTVGPTFSTAQSTAAEYFFSAATVVGLAWPVEGFSLPLLRDTVSGHSEEGTAVSVGASQALPVVPMSVLVRAHVLGAAVARRTRRFRKAIALLRVAEAWIEEVFGRDDQDSAPWSTGTAGSAAPPRCVTTLREDLLARLDARGTKQLTEYLSEIGSPGNSMDVLDGILRRWCRLERWCCVRLVRAEMCQVYHTLATSVHATQLLHASSTVAAVPATAGRSLAGLSSLVGSAHQGRRASTATLDVKARLREYGEHVNQLAHSATAQPTLAEVMASSAPPLPARGLYSRTVVAWSAALADCCVRGELPSLAEEHGTERPADQAAAVPSLPPTPLEEATDMVLTHYRALSLILCDYYEAAAGPRSDSTGTERGRTQAGSLAGLFARQGTSSATRKRAREEVDSEVEAHARVGGERSGGNSAAEMSLEAAQAAASEYDLLCQLALLGFDGSLVRWNQWQQESRGGAEETARLHPRPFPHWLSSGVRCALTRLLQLFGSVHCPTAAVEHVAVTPDAHSPLALQPSPVEQSLRELLRCVDHEMLALSGRHDATSIAAGDVVDEPTPRALSSGGTPRKLLTSASLSAATGACARHLPRHVQLQASSPFQQVRLLILIKTSALMLAASSQLQQLNLCAALTQIGTMQSFMGVLYRHVQHVATCRVEMHVLVATLALQLQLRDISAVVLEEALVDTATAHSASSATAGDVPHPGSAETTSLPPSFLSQLRGGLFATAESAASGGAHLPATTFNVAGVASGTGAGPLLTDLMHDVGLPLFHLVAAEQAAQEGLLYTHPSARLLVRLLQAFAVYQAASHNACRLELPHSGVASRTGPTWRPLAATQKQRCASALRSLVAPLEASFDMYEAEDGGEAEGDGDGCARAPAGATRSTRGWPLAWSPANRVLFLLLRGLGLLMDDYDVITARRTLKKAAQLAKQHLGMLDALTADGLQWLATATKLSEALTSPAEEVQGRVAQYEVVAMQVAARCSSAALWRLGENLEQPIMDEGSGGEREVCGAHVSAALSARWETAVNEVCGAEEGGATPDDNVHGGEVDTERSMMAYKRRKLLVAAMTFLPGTSSYARLS